MVLGATPLLSRPLVSHSFISSMKNIRFLAILFLLLQLSEPKEGLRWFHIYGYREGSTTGGPPFSSLFVVHDSHEVCVLLAPRAELVLQRLLWHLIPPPKGG